MRKGDEESRAKPNGDRDRQRPRGYISKRNETQTNQTHEEMVKNKSAGHQSVGNRENNCDRQKFPFDCQLLFHLILHYWVISP